MSKTRYIVCLLIFCSAICRAEDVVTTHNFTTLLSASQLALSDGNTVGKVGDVVYTCEGTKAEFGTKLDGGTDICINLPTADSYVIISPPFERLNQLDVRFYYESTKYDPEKILVEFSENGVEWREMPRLFDFKGQIMTNEFPIAPYYIKITNKKKADMSIFKISYYQSPCYCFDHQAE